MIAYQTTGAVFLHKDAISFDLLIITRLDILLVQLHIVGIAWFDDDLIQKTAQLQLWTATHVMMVVIVYDSMFVV